MERRGTANSWHPCGHTCTISSASNTYAGGEAAAGEGRGRQIYSLGLGTLYTRLTLFIGLTILLTSLILVFISLFP